MTRAIAVALGAIGAALVVSASGPNRPACVIAAVGCVGAGLLAHLALGVRPILDGGHARPSTTLLRARPLAVGIGAAAVLLRAGLGPGGLVPVVADGVASASGTGRVVSVAAPRDARQRFVLATGDPPLLLDARAPRYPEVGAGAEVAWSGKVRSAGPDSYGRSLVARGIAGTVEIRTLGLLAPDDGPGAILAGLRTAADASLRASIPEPAGGLAAGVLLGLRERVSRAVSADFVATGLSHVVAISGWNIAIVVAALAALLRPIGRRPRIAFTLAAVCAYVALVGASPPVIRAALMAGTVLAAREAGRSAGATTALAWAITAMLVADPAAVGDQGFRLSTAATAGLIAWGTPLTDWIGRWRGGRVPGPVAEALGVSLAAQAATLPLVLAGFGRVSLVSPAVNLVVAPVVAPAMAAGAAALVGGTAALAVGLPQLAAVAGIPAWVTFGAIVAVASAGARVPFASVTVSAPWDTVLGVISAAVVLLVGTARGRRLLGRAGPHGSVSASSAAPAATRATADRPDRHAVGGGRRDRVVAVCLAVALAGVGVGAARLPDGHPRIEVLDVGQGDAILVTGSHGGRALVDGGPDPDRLVAALDARVAPWDRRIDLVVVSHPHDDHVAGLAGLFGRYEIRRALGNGAAGSGPGWRAWTEGLASRGIREGVVATGDVLHVDDVVLAVLWPDRATVSTRPSGDGRAVNDASVVLLGTAQGVRFLLPGDAEDDVDPTLASRGLPHVSVYKVAHHGSRTASSDALLGAIDAAIAVISVGSGNTYGHPSPATLARLAAHRAAVLRTDERGTIAVTFDRGRASVAAERPSASSALRYHRRDDRPWARRVREASPLPRPAAVVPPARARGGGGRSVARAAHVRRGHDRRRPPHRGGRAPP